jgi:hypothetical protein
LQQPTIGDGHHGRPHQAQSAYDRAQAELDSLAAAKPAAEVQSLIDAAKADLAKLPATRSVAELEALMRRGCNHGTALQGSGEGWLPQVRFGACSRRERKNLTSKIAELTNDIARAEQRRTEQRAKAQAATDRASGELAVVQPARIANSDAKALTLFLIPWRTRS